MGPLRALAAALFGRGGVPALPAGASVERDLAYGSEPAQKLDIYRPGEAPNGAVVVVVHGGAWAIGDKANPAVVAAKAAHWLPAGIVVASVNYRLLPVAEPVEQAADVARAIAFVQRRAASWGADAARLVVVGHSTGAHLAALLAADAELREAAGAEPWLATVLLDSAALDVVALMQAPHRPLYDRAFGAAEAGWRQASPLHRLHDAPAPMLLVHADTRDDAGAQARRFANQVEAVGGRAEVMAVELSHVEINAAVGRDNAMTERIDQFLRSVGVP